VKTEPVPTLPSGNTLPGPLCESEKPERSRDGCIPRRRASGPSVPTRERGIEPVVLGMMRRLRIDCNSCTAEPRTSFGTPSAGCSNRACGNQLQLEGWRPSACWHGNCEKFVALKSPPSGALGAGTEEPRARRDRRHCPLRARAAPFQVWPTRDFPQSNPRLDPARVFSFAPSPRIARTTGAIRSTPRSVPEILAILPAGRNSLAPPRPGCRRSARTRRASDPRRPEKGNGTGEEELTARGVNHGISLGGRADVVDHAVGPGPH
jgi:hypothetical protein